MLAGMGEERFRNKITWFTFFFSVLVVWVHSYNGELFLGKTAEGMALLRFERIFGDLAGQIAVPGFFLISAYLFYRNFSWERLGTKWMSRLHSIVIPYVLWNFVYYLGYVAGSRLPFISHVIGKGKIPFDLFALADVIVHYRYLYVFWYLQQLILLVVLAPVLFAVLKRAWSGLVFLLAVLLAILFAVDIPCLNEDALFYYGAGAFLALQGRKMEKAWSRKRCFAGIGLAILGFWNLYLTKRYYFPVTTVGYRLLMPLGLWLITDEKKLAPARPWMECNFFLYATHFAFVRFLNKTAALFASGTFFLPAALYFFMPGLMTGVSFGISLVMKRYFPRLWKVMNGGR